MVFFSCYFTHIGVAHLDLVSRPIAVPPVRGHPEAIPWGRTPREEGQELPPGKARLSWYCPSLTKFPRIQLHCGDRTNPE